MTQRARVLKMLQEAGTKGVRSDEFIAAYMPRAAARVKELRDEGYEITSEQERQFVRYKLSAGSGAGEHGVGTSSASVDSGSGSTGGQGQPEEHTSAPDRHQAVDKAPGAPARVVPSMFDPDVQW